MTYRGPLTFQESLETPLERKYPKMLNRQWRTDRPTGEGPKYWLHFSEINCQAEAEAFII